MESPRKLAIIAACLQVPWAASTIGWVFMFGNESASPGLDVVALGLAGAALGLGLSAGFRPPASGRSKIMLWAFYACISTGIWVFVTGFINYQSIAALLPFFDIVGAVGSAIGLYRPITIGGYDGFNFLSFLTWIGRLGSTSASVLLFMAARVLGRKTKIAVETP